MLPAIWSRARGSLACPVPGLFRGLALPTDKQHQQITPSGAPGDAPPEAQVSQSPELSEMNPGVPAPARGGNDATQVM